MKHMDEAEAWRKIAEAFAGKPGTTITCFGLCFAARECQASTPVRESMCARLDLYVVRGDWAYDDVSCRGYHGAREARCLAALWLAEDAEHEARTS